MDVIPGKSKTGFWRSPGYYTKALVAVQDKYVDVITKCSQVHDGFPNIPIPLTLKTLGFPFFERASFLLCYRITIVHNDYTIFRQVLQCIFNIPQREMIFMHPINQ